MSLLMNGVMFIGGTLLFIYCIEEFIEHLSKTALSFGLSAFFLSVILAGLDLENWAVGISALLKATPEFSIGSAIGSALFLAGMSLGLAGFLVPFEEQVPRDYLTLMVFSPIILLPFLFDRSVSRIEGVILLIVLILFLGYLYRVEKIKPRGYMRNEEVEETVEEAEALKRSKWTYLAFTLLFTVGFIIGIEIAVRGAKGIVESLSLNSTIFGMTVVGVASSAEEITLTIEPVRKGKREIAIGNLIGSLFFFSTGNIGLLGVLSPFSIERVVLTFYWPYLLILTGLVGLFLFNGRVKRIEGGILITVYSSYWVLSYTLL